MRKIPHLSRDIHDFFHNWQDWSNLHVLPIASLFSDLQVSQVGISWDIKNYFRGTTKEKMFKNSIISDYFLYPMTFNMECLVIIIQMGYYIQESLKNRLSTYEEFLGPVYRKTSA